MNFKNLLLLFVLSSAIIISCDKDELNSFSGTPSNVSASISITQDDSGLVTITPTAENTRQFLIEHGDGSSQSITNGNSATHTYAEGTYTVAVIASNGTGQTAEFTQSITISFTPPSNLMVGVEVNGATVTVTPTASNAMNFNVYYGEDANAAPESVMAGGTGSYTYSQAGDYTIRVVAMSASATTIETTETVTISAGANPIAFPVDFESSASVNYSFVAFGPDGDHATVVANPDASGINTSGTVVQFNKVAGAEVWAGSFFELGAPMDFANNNQVSVKVWSPKAGALIKLKVENLTDGSIAAEKDLNVTAANTWEELVYDFSDIDVSQSYQKVVIFFDFGNAGDDSNFYYDDVQLSAAATSGGGGSEVVAFPVDFESATLNYDLFAFGGDGVNAIVIDNPDASGENTSAKVVQHDKVAGSEVWAGSGLTLAEPIDFDASKILRLKVWSPNAGIPVRLKVENASDAAIFAELDVNVTAANTWEELVYDFSSIDASMEYSKVVVFFDFGTAGDGSTYYYDGVESGDGSGGGGSDAVAFPVGFESATVPYNLFAFGGDGVNAVVVDNPDASGANTSDKVVQHDKAAGSEVWAGSGFELAQDIDLSSSTTIKLKVWSPKAGVPIRLKLENSSDAAIFAELDVNVTAANTWEELTYDFSGIDTSQSFSKVVVFFDFGTAGDGSTYYYDDVIR